MVLSVDERISAAQIQSLPAAPTQLTAGQLTIAPGQYRQPNNAESSPGRIKTVTFSQTAANPPTIYADFGTGKRSLSSPEVGGENVKLYNQWAAEVGTTDGKEDEKNAEQDQKAQEAQQQAEDQARDAQIEQNKVAIDPYFQALGSQATPEETPDEATAEPDLNFFYYMKSDKAVDGINIQTEWLDALTDFKEKLIQDITIPLPRKLESLDNLKEYMRIATSIKQNYWEKNAVTAGIAGDIRTLKEAVGQTGRGELALLLPTPGDGLLESEILLFGHKAKRALKGLKSLKGTFTRAINKYNEISDSEKIEKTWVTVQVQRGGTPGDDNVTRGEVDEALMGAAGSLHSLAMGKLAGGVSPKRHEFLVGKIRDDVSEIMKGETLEKIAGYLSLGLENNSGEGVSTLLSETAGEFTQAIKDRLRVMFGEDFDSDGFVDELAQDVKKAIALVLAFRSQTIKNVLGDMQPEASVVMGKRGEGKTGRKVDNGFFFRPDQQEALADHLSWQLRDPNTGQPRKKGPKAYTETETIASFIKKGLLKEDGSDLPPEYKDPQTGEIKDSNQELTLLRLSLKTHNNHNSDSSQGSCRASASVPRNKEPLKGIKKDADTAIRKNISDSAAEHLRDFNDTMRKILWKKSGGKNALDSEEQNKRYWGEVKKQTESFDDDKEREDFGKALAINLFMIGGGSRAPQLNVVSYTAEADYTVQDDHGFRNTFLANIKSGTWTVHAPQSAADSSLINIKDPQSGRVMVKIKGRGKRNDIWKTSSYQKQLLEKQNHLFIGPTQEPAREDNSTMFREFLEGQAKLIQTLLVNE